ncbi:YD repeat protein [Nitrospirillum viridazoti Y2]|nr:YD repeat protein [Nitrospirillum amazonense Y2]
MYLLAIALTGALPGAAQAGDTKYEYDNLGRLKQVTAPSGAITVYTYDNAGNRTAATTSGGSATSNYATNTVIVLPLLGGFVLPIAKDSWQ